MKLKIEKYSRVRYILDKFVVTEEGPDNPIIQIRRNESNASCLVIKDKSEISNLISLLKEYEKSTG